MNTAAEGYAHHVHSNDNVQTPSSGASLEHRGGDGQSEQSREGQETAAVLFATAWVSRARAPDLRFM